ncbi:hypothetical protein IMSHALPRED_005426 [Imshaugia aleurites]|uniref:Heterokaryon incompatibility domain-containing protein n=1 Tax=Imshaugia aleurites TaxID=172621 RepID=A0A8H3EJQ2_9LECA|nr:hypothetical protein IMSHALPRED_005426 [Imshaugia aleurites]
MIVLPPPHQLRRRVDGNFVAQDLYASTTAYQYTPLKEDMKEIRLVTLHEGDFEVDIRISIDIVRLTPYNPPIFEALSYVWGSEKNPVDIQVGSGTLSISRNLAEALTYLRFKDKRRKLWIDAISVDQRDLKERGLQVKRMADVYKLAKSVVAFLGPAKSNSGHGMKTLEHLGSQIRYDSMSGEMKPASDDVDEDWSDDRKTLPYGEKEQSGIYEILQRPWFERLWIQQEIRLSSQNAILMCGLDSVAWQSFRLAIICLFKKDWSGTQIYPILPSLIERVGEIIEIDNNLSYNFMDLMRQTKRCKCLDPRDRVYAILSLLNDVDKAAGIEPDYEKTTSQVYQDVTLRLIALRQHANILTVSGLENKPSGMPTWVPDWTNFNAAYPLSNALASGSTYFELHEKATGIISVTGLHSATIGLATRFRTQGYEGLIAEIKLFAPLDVLEGSYVAGGSLLEAYCKTICSNCFADSYMPHLNDRAQLQRSKDLLFTLLQPEKQLLSDYCRGTQADDFLRWARTYCEQRSFIKTREGHIGLAPRVAQAGDKVCVLLGCSQPLLLRPAPNDSQYQVVGECYVHRLMQGEAFLGKLPDRYQVVDVFDERSRRYHQGFLNRLTGRTQYNDPRLESRLDDDGDKVPRFRYPDGSQSRPLTAKMLENRGVKLQSFDLI